MDQRAKMLGRQYAKAITEDSPNILYLPNEADLGECHLLVTGLSSPYGGGEYIFKLTMPPEFPHKPPGAVCLTENGVYAEGARFCLSIGEYHADDFQKDKGDPGGAWGWRPALGVRGFARELVNGLIVPEELNLAKHPDSGKGGIGIEDTTKEERAEFAARSAVYNSQRNAAIRAQFERLADASPALAAARAWRAGSARSWFKNGATALMVDPDDAEAEFVTAFGEGFRDWCRERVDPLLMNGIVSHHVCALGKPAGHNAFARSLASWDNAAEWKGEAANQLALAGGVDPAGQVTVAARLAAARSILAEAYPFLEAGQAAALVADPKGRLVPFLHFSMVGDFASRDKLLVKAAAGAAAGAAGGAAAGAPAAAP